ncbi:hypothetical protein GGR56DRAFT_148469 [Xylariaceae sp. FL0804]|nr:hypothetical protein GGR56DRAFT_148469 [Xylariaceae sp. FL0804]
MPQYPKAGLSLAKMQRQSLHFRRPNPYFQGISPWNVSEESIASVRHFTALGILTTLADKNLGLLKEVDKTGIKARLASAFMVRFINDLPFLSYALSFWQGSRLLITGAMSAATVFTATMAIVIGFAISRVAPNLQAFVASIGSAGLIIRSMQRSPPRILFPSTLLDQRASRESWSSIYPSRPCILILKDVGLNSTLRNPLAIVGPTVSRRCRIIGLIRRFYRPTGGRITLDGHDIQELNVRWLRNQVDDNY